MKALTLHIVLIFISGLLFSLRAQSATAVMEVRANVISGASISTIDSPQIELPSNTLDFQSFKAGSFSLTTSPSADVNVSVSSDLEMKNEWGELIRVDLIDVVTTSSESGKHDITLNGHLNNKTLSKGNYKGNLVAVIDYL